MNEVTPTNPGKAPSLIPRLLCNFCCIIQYATNYRNGKKHSYIVADQLVYCKVSLHDQHWRESQIKRTN